MEHVYRFVKDILKNLGPNLNEKSAERISRATQGVKIVLDIIYTNFNITDNSSSQKEKKDIEDVQKLAKEVQRAKIFQYLPPRQHESLT